LEICLGLIDARLFSRRRRNFVPMIKFEDKALKQILPQFYATYNLPPDGGFSSSYVQIDLTKKFHVFIPNFDARRKAVIKHDIHHITTGYSAGSMVGEAEIGAWEIASGINGYWAAYVLDIAGAMYGLLISPRKVFKAFARGRRTKNLYLDEFSIPQSLDMTIAEMQRQLLLDKHSIDTKANFTDYLRFAGFITVGALWSLISIVFLPFVIFYSLYITLRKSA
jgi:hypothetical protein